MKVKELIKYLVDCDMDAEVKIGYTDGRECAYIETTFDVEEKVDDRERNLVILQAW